MAFVIENISGANTNLIERKLLEAINNSRFNALLSNTGKKIEIRQVRLNERKDYCGNHPFACPVRPFVKEKPHNHTKNLEGADWVAWNDMINDVLDAMGVTANVASSHCIIRKGAERRIEYNGHTLGNGVDSEWDRDSSEYANRIGQISQRSEYPEGTPGIPEWKA